MLELSAPKARLNEEGGIESRRTREATKLFALLYAAFCVRLGCLGMARRQNRR